MQLTAEVQFSWGSQEMLVIKEFPQDLQQDSVTAGGAC